MADPGRQVWLEEVAREVERRTGIDTSHYAGAVQARMSQMTAERNRLGFLKQDTLDHLVAECADIGVDAMNEVQRLNSERVAPPDTVHYHLYEAAIYAAIAEAHARSARAAMRGSRH